jgi:transcriptional regulator with XRE-family HTH domain
LKIGRFRAKNGLPCGFAPVRHANVVQLSGLRRGKVVAINGRMARMKPNSSETTPDPVPPPDYAARIRSERQKRAWTQEYLAEKSGLSPRTVQRLECGESPSPETIKLLAAAFGMDAEELASTKNTKTEFIPQTLWYTSNLGLLALCALFTLVLLIFYLHYELSYASYQAWEIVRAKQVLYAETAIVGFLWLNVPFLVIGYGVKNGTLRLLHMGWFGKYDLREATGIARCQQVDMGTVYLAPPELIFPKGLFYNRLIGFFSGHISAPKNAVLVEFGKKKVVVTPEDPDAFIQAVREQVDELVGRTLPIPTCIAENIATDADYSEKIRSEREKRGWTQAELAGKAKLSVRTVQRLEKGTPPSSETLRLIAETLGIDVSELTQNVRRTHFKCPYSKSEKLLVGVTTVALLLIVIFPIPLMTPGGRILLPHYLFAWAIDFLLFSNLYTQVRGLILKDGRLRVCHIGFVAKYDLSKLTAMEINPQAMIGAIPLSIPIFMLTPWCKSPSLGVFRSLATDESKCVVMEFGKKKIVVTPDDPQAFVEAVHEELKALEIAEAGMEGKQPVRRSTGA